MESYKLFQGKVSKLFDELKAGRMEALTSLKVIEHFGSHHITKEGKEIPLFQWEDGDRRLAEYEEDGSLFLIQTSSISKDDDFQVDRDWYQVESKDHAHEINEHMDGFALSYHYEGPKLWTSDEGYHYRLEKNGKSHLVKRK